MRESKRRNRRTPGTAWEKGGQLEKLSDALECRRLLQADYWSRGVAHRRIVLVFTADEERGYLGAKYLNRHQPELIANMDVALCMDRPLDFRSNYPQELLVAVVWEKDSAVLPYKRVLDLMQDFCERTKMRFGRTENQTWHGRLRVFSRLFSLPGCSCEARCEAFTIGNGSMSGT